MENVKTLKIHAQEIENGKQKFIACSTNVNGKWFKVKFTKACIDAPKTRGLYDLTICYEDCSVELGKPYTKNDGSIGKENDTIWVRNIAGLRAYTEEDMKAENISAVKSLFGEE